MMEAGAVVLVVFLFLLFITIRGAMKGHFDRNSEREELKRDG